MAIRKGLVHPKYESIALHPLPADVEVDERLELDDAIQQVIFAMRAFMRDYGSQSGKPSNPPTSSTPQLL
jgi:hypothetical protein